MLDRCTNAPKSPREDLNLKPSAYQTDAQTGASSVANRPPDARGNGGPHPAPTYAAAGAGVLRGPRSGPFMRRNVDA